MGAFHRFGVYPGRVGDILLRQIDQAEIMPANSKSEVQVGGTLDRAAVITAFAEPVFRTRTADFGLLAASPTISLLAGYLWDTDLATIDGGVNTAAALLQFQKRASGGTFVAGAQHLLASIPRGWCCIEEISAEQDDVNGAQLQIAGVALSQDGISSPINFTANNNLTSTPNFGSLFYLSKVMVGTAVPAQLTGVRSVRIRPGLRFLVKRADGNPFAIRGAIVQRFPEIRIQVDDPSQVYTLLNPSLFGLDLASLKVECFFQRGLHGGTRVSAASTVHVSIAATTGDETPDQLGVSGVENDMGAELVIRPTGTITLATGIAIP